MMVAMSMGMNAQTVQKQVVEEGGTGPFKSEVVGDASCPGFTVYRPQNLKEIVAKQGALPVIVYANGACFNNNVEMRLLLSEVASYGHSGTYYEKYGGNYAKAVVKWLDWQLKGRVGQSALFLDDEYLKMKFPEWQGVRKNF